MNGLSISYLTTMNNDCLFGILLCCGFSKKLINSPLLRKQMNRLCDIIKCFLICKQFSYLDIKYFWKLLNKTHHDGITLINNYYDNYKVYHNLSILQRDIFVSINLHDIYI